MNEHLKIKWGIESTRILGKGTWSFGLGTTKEYDQAYIFINLFKHSIFIGRFVQEVKANE